MPTRRESTNPLKKKPEEALFTRQFIAIALTNFAMFTSFQMTTAGLPVYVKQLGASSVEISLVATLMTLTALMMRPFAGFILDSFNKKGVLIAGLAVLVVITVSYGLFPLVGMILGLRAVFGVGWGIAATATSAIVALILPRPRFAEGMGWYSLGMALGFAVGPALSIYLINSVSAEVMIMVASVALAVALALTVTVNPPKVKRKGIRLRDVLHFDSLFERSAFFPAALILLVNTGTSAIGVFIAVYGLERGVTDIALYYVVNAAVSLIVRPPLGRWVDTKGMFAPGILAALAMALTLVTVGLSDTLWKFCLAGAFGGIAAALSMCAYQTMAVAAAPLERKGVATSTYMTGFDAGMCAGSLVAGGLATVLGYSAMFIVMAAFPLMACVLFLAAFRRWQESAA